VLTPDVRVEGFDSTEWSRLSDLFRAARAVDPNVERGGVVAVTTGPRLRKLVSTERGRLDPAAEPWPQDLEAIRVRHHARWAAELAFGALDELAERFADRVRPGQDFLTQSLELIETLRELEARGSLRVVPGSLAAWPVPKEHVVLSVADALCPPGKTIVLTAFENGDLYTCLAARRGERGFDLLIGPSELRPDIGFLSGDFRRDYRYVAEAVERRVAPLALGCYAEIATFRRLARGDILGGWATAVAARDVILSPAPAALALPLGLDIGRAAFAGFRALADRAGVGAWLGGVGAKIGRSEGFQALERDISQRLGFDPLKLARDLLSR
jgi:hypothetical protein